MLTLQYGVHDLSCSQLPVLFLLTVYSFSIFGCKEYNQSDFGIDWWCPCVESYLVLLEEVFAMTSAFSWQNSVSLCPASFCTPRPNLPVTPGISWLPTFVFHFPVLKRTSFCLFVCFLMLVLEGLVGLHRSVQLQLLQHYWSGHRLGLLWYWMVCLGNEHRSFCCFGDCTQVLHFRLFCWGLLHFF